jgi:DnaJ-class molecular chaperone
MTELIPQKTAILFSGDTRGKENEPWGLYNILGLSGGESREEVRERARELRGQYHPDRKRGDRAAFETIGEVRDVLTGDESKERYDTWSKVVETFEPTEEGFEGIGEHMSRKHRSERRRSQIMQNLKKVDRREGTDYHDRYSSLKEEMREAESLEEMKSKQVDQHMLLSEAFGANVEREEIEDKLDEFHEERRENTESFVQDLRTSYGRQKYKEKK